MIHDYLADLPDFQYENFRSFFDDITVKYTERIAMRILSENGMDYDVWKYADLKRDVLEIARFFMTLHLHRGDCVGVLSENRPEWCVVYLAAVIAGFVIVPIDVQLDADESKAVMAKSGIEILFTSGRFVERIPRYRSGCSALSIFVNFDEEAEKSKGVMLSHSNILKNVNASIMSLPIDKNDVCITVLPLHHTYPTTCSFLSPLTVGGSITFTESLAGKKIIANIRETGGTVLIGVPLLFDKIKQGMRIRFRELPLLKRVVLNGFQAVSRITTRYLNIPMGRMLFRSLREKAGLATLRLLVSGGGPMNTDVKIDHPNREGIGEILVKSPSVMKGYFKNDEATRDSITRSGYLRTGDLGRIDKRGFVYITGRIKNLIVTPCVWSGKHVMNIFFRKG